MTTATTYTIDPDEEELVELAEVPAIMARWKIRRPHINAVRRWTKRGIRGIPLPSVLVGPRLYTSREAIKWWLAVTTAAKTNKTPAPGTAAGPDVRYPMRPSTRRTLRDGGFL